MSSRWLHPSWAGATLQTCTDRENSDCKKRTQGSGPFWSPRGPSLGGCLSSGPNLFSIYVETQKPPGLSFLFLFLSLPPENSFHCSIWHSALEGDFSSLSPSKSVWFGAPWRGDGPSREFGPYSCSPRTRETHLPSWRLRLSTSQEHSAPRNYRAPLNLCWVKMKTVLIRNFHVRGTARRLVNDSLKINFSQNNANPVFYLGSLSLMHAESGVALWFSRTTGYSVYGIISQHKLYYQGALTFEWKYITQMILWVVVDANRCLS